MRINPQEATGRPYGGRVRSAREAAGVSLRDLSRRIGVSPATMSQIEQGKTGLSVDRLDHIAEALGIRASDIFDDVDIRWARVGSRGGSQRGADTRTGDRGWRDYDPLAFPPILDAALEEFLARGYHGTSMRRIAARSGVPVSSIYRTFRGKQELLYELLDLTMTDLEWRTDAAIAEGGSAVDRFCHMVENLALYHTHRRQLGFLGASEVRALESRNRADIARRRNRQQSLLDEHVYAAVRLGQFSAIDPDDASRAVVTLCTALPTWWQPNGRLTPEEVADEYVDYALNLMSYRGRRP